MRALLASKGSCYYSNDARMPELTPFRNVLIKVYYAGICRTDLLIARGLIDHKDNVILGHEFCGVIESFYNDECCDGWKKGMVVSCNPMMFSQSEDKEEMCGKDVDGAFAEYIAVPTKALVELPSCLLNQLGAYIEPVAAALAPVKFLSNHPGENVCVFGNNRIAELTVQVAHFMGHENVKRVRHLEELVPDSYDCIIETEAEYIDKYINALRPGKTLILKSRAFLPATFIPNSIAMKEINIQGARYGDFDMARHILASTSDGFGRGLDTDCLFGSTYDLSDFEIAFSEARQPAGKKVFFRICVE